MAMKYDLLSVVLPLLIILTIIPTKVNSIGICYGMVADDLPEPGEVIKLYKKYGISAMRIYAPNATVLNALKDTDIKLMMGVPDDLLGSFANDKSAVTKWVQNNIIAYPGVSFKYIVVGNEVPAENTSNALLAMTNIWDALRAEGFEGKIQVSTALSFAAFINSYPPSNTEFNPNYNIGPIVKFLANTGNPLFVHIYPFFAYKGNPSQIDLNYALFEPSTTEVKDQSYTYHNLFDAMLDSVYYALEKADGPNVGVVVTESGWPSAGADAVGTTVKNAQKYNQNLINHIAGTGTPKKPGSVETYIFSMFNERNKPGDEVERHFGLFYPDKTPVYSIKFGNSSTNYDVSHDSHKIRSIFVNGSMLSVLFLWSFYLFFFR